MAEPEGGYMDVDYREFEKRGELVGVRGFEPPTPDTP